jgi:hypothetical protein
MQCCYRGWVIDATPDFCLGKYFARVRMIRASADDTIDGEMHIQRDLAWSDTQDEAVAVAQQWAFAWIAKRDGEAASAGDSAYRDIPGAIPSDIPANLYSNIPSGMHSGSRANP